jgi:chaperonin GroES
MDEQPQEDATTQKPLAAMLESINIAEKLSEEQLHHIGSEAYQGFDLDLQSRQEWEQHIDAWTKLAKQTVEPKSYPWPKASNIKYPLLSTAAMQFAARAYPSLLPSNGKIVSSRPIGKDPDGSKSKIAEAVSTYMSYQLLEEMDGWEEEMDKLLIMLPITGTMFKKTYWDSLNETNMSVLVMPKNLVVNYWARTLKDAERISEIMEMSPRKVKERQQSGLWLDIDLGSAPTPTGQGSIPSNDSTTPYSIIEQHTFLDLDDDGYKEPYIVTFHKESHKVLRIVARYDETTIKLTQNGSVSKIDPIQYYTKFGFIPNPDGSFYDIGFGMLLGPLNESVNTLINQLLDAGHLSTLQAGFLGKGLRIKMGDTGFQPGEWKAVNSTGDDLKKQIVPLPTKEPSGVLFQLMGSLITSGKELASIAEIFTGKMPGQNTPATTTMATVEQGMKVFTAVYKRLYRSLAEEFIKLARLNNLYLNPQTYVETVGMDVGPKDFDMTSHKIYPGADPTAISQTEKLLKAQGLMELLPTGILDPVKVVQRVLDAQEQPNWHELLITSVQQTGQTPPPPPDPKLQEMQMKGQAEQQKIALQGQALQHKMELETRGQETQLAMKAQEHAQNMQHAAEMANIKGAAEIHKLRIFSAQDQADFIQSLMHKELEHKQTMQHASQQAKKPSKRS